MPNISLNKLWLHLIVLQFNILHSDSETNGLKIGAFNVQVFGASKMRDSDVVTVLVKIISKYDIILIQEIRDSTGDAIEELLATTNRQNSNNPFSMKISPRLGRTNSKEQYAFLYREKSGLKVDREYVYDDGNESLNTDTETFDTFEREPYIVLFESSKTQLKRFAVAGLHAAPSEAVEELQALEYVFDDINKVFGISDIIVMGDLNADCSYVPNYKWDTIAIKNNPLYTWWIGDQTDTTVSNSNCAYDRFISTGDGFKAGVVNGSATVFRFDSEFQLNQTFSLDVSDHYPIQLYLVYDLKTSDAQKVTTIFVTCILQCISVNIFL